MSETVMHQESETSASATADHNPNPKRATKMGPTAILGVASNRIIQGFMYFLKVRLSVAAIAKPIPIAVPILAPNKAF